MQNKSGVQDPSISTWEQVCAPIGFVTARRLAVSGQPSGKESACLMALWEGRPPSFDQTNACKNITFLRL